jgi:hypothetical protein
MWEELDALAQLAYRSGVEIMLFAYSAVIAEFC